MSEFKRPVFDFSGKTVLVTGGTSGMGAASVEAFARSGAHVVFTGRNHDRAENLLELIRPYDTKAHFVAGDITDVHYCVSLINQTSSLIGTPDIVVNSAGVIYHAIAEDTCNGY